MAFDVAFGVLVVYLALFCLESIIRRREVRKP